MQQLLVVISLLFTSLLFAQTSESKKIDITKGTTVKVTVVNALNDNGTIHYALYNEKTFMVSKPLKGLTAKIKEGKSWVEFTNVESGAYAIICFHDENENGKMDFQPNGMPLENYGTSNNTFNMGPPTFIDAKFDVHNEEVNLEIKF